MNCSQAGDGVQSVRTSSTAWCDARTCQRDETLARVRRRIANLTLVPERNAEHMQVLKSSQTQNASRSGSPTDLT